jgi:hypothetical protein
MNERKHFAELQGVLAVDRTIARGQAPLHEAVLPHVKHAIPILHSDLSIECARLSSAP